MSLRNFVNHRWLIRIALSLAGILLAVNLAFAVGESLKQSAGISGGGQVTNGAVTLRSSIGQPVAGTVSNGQEVLCTGIGCTGSASAPTDDPIQGLAALNDGPTVVGSSTVLTATIAGGTGIGYAWDYGDGQSGSGQVTNHIYTSAGVYTATVTAGNGAGTVQAQTVVHVAHVVVEVGNNFFAPATVSVNLGETVAWVRRGGFHNVVAEDDSFTSGAPSSTWSAYSHTFTTPGVYPYFCEIHRSSGMAGVVTILSDQNSSLTQRVFLPVARR